MAEALTQLAPRHEQAARLGVAQDHRPHRALGLLAGLGPIAQPQFSPVPDRRSQACGIDVILGLREGRLRADAGLGDKGAQTFGHDGGDFRHHVAGRCRKSPVGTARHPLRAQHHRLDLVRRQHQRRHVVIGGKQVAEPRLALDRNPLADEVGDVPVDGALRDFEFLRQRGRRRRPARPAEDLDDLKQPVGPTHADSCCQNAVSRPVRQDLSRRAGGHDRKDQAHEIRIHAPHRRRHQVLGRLLREW